MIACTVRVALGCALGLFASIASAADVGRVILAAGDTVAVRGNQTVRLMLGAAVQDSDVLRTGAASNIQVRFTDETIVSIRENSEMRVEEYNFTGKNDGSENMGLRLLKGGLRVVTGLVGRSNEKNFAVRTTTATIGIRGTDFGTAICQQDCRNADGSLARDGQYGRVHGQSHGTNQINVSNERDTRTFGINENFYVADAKSIVEPLLTPPDFVASRLESRKQGGTGGTAGGTGQEQTTTGGSSQDSRVTELPPPPQPLSYTATEERSSTGSVQVTGNATATPTIAGVGSVFFGAGGRGDKGVFATPDDLVTDPPGAASDLSRTQALVGFNIPASRTTDGTATSGSTSHVHDETQPNSLNAHWGRWENGSITSDGVTTAVTPQNQFHYLYGPLTPYDTIAAKSGTFTMTNVLGTTPTNQAASTGTYNTGNLTVNFTAQTLTFPASSANFANGDQWSFQGGTAQIMRGNGGAFITLTSTGQCTNGTCPSVAPGPATLNRTGVFMGNRGDHIGVTFQARTNSGAQWFSTSRIFTCAAQNC